MLKFSGFADLTSCLGKKTAPAARARGTFQRQKTTTEKKHEGALQVARRRNPHALHASEAPPQREERPDAQTQHTAGTQGCELEQW